MSLFSVGDMVRSTSARCPPGAVGMVSEVYPATNFASVDDGYRITFESGDAIILLENELMPDVQPSNGQSVFSRNGRYNPR